MMLTDRDLQIVDVLTGRLGILDFEHLSEVWWNGDERSARRRLQTLVKGVVIEKRVVNVCPRRREPYLQWIVGDRMPDFEQVRAATRGRWEIPTQSVEVFSASAHTANLFGSDPDDVPDFYDRNRALLLGDAFTAWSTARSMKSSRWLSEIPGDMEESGHGRPDVLIADDRGNPFHAIGLVSGSTQRMEEVHSFCSSREVPYELW